MYLILRFFQKLPGLSQNAVEALEPVQLHLAACDLLFRLGNTRQVLLKQVERATGGRESRLSHRGRFAQFREARVDVHSEGDSLDGGGIHALREFLRTRGALLCSCVKIRKVPVPQQPL